MKKIKWFIFMALFLAVFLASLDYSLAQTQNEGAKSIQDQIKILLKQIEELKTKLSALQGQSSQWCFNFNENLKIGSNGHVVKALRTALSKEGFNLNEPEGENFFGESTAASVSGFQQKYKNEILTPNGLQYGTGFVGKSTRAKLNSLYGCGSKVNSDFIVSNLSSSSSQNSKVDIYVTDIKINGGENKIETDKPIYFTFELHFDGYIKESFVVGDMYKITFDGKDREGTYGDSSYCYKTTDSESKKSICKITTRNVKYNEENIGKRTIDIFADPLNKISEHNEKNNILSFDFVVLQSSPAISSSANSSYSSLAQQEEIGKKSRDSKRLADINMIQIALELYQDANKGFFPGSLYDLVGTYLAVFPVDGLGNSYDYRPVPYGCSQNSANSCTNYHLGANLELKNNIKLLSDADQITPTPAGINGSDENSCRTIGDGITRYCYDVVGSLPINENSTSSSASSASSINNNISNIKAKATYSFQLGYEKRSGSQQVLFASYILDASNEPENVSISSVKLKYESLSGGKPTDLANCKIYSYNNTNELASNAVILTSGINSLNPYYNGTQTINFDSSLIIPGRGVKILDLKCDTIGSANGQYKWSIIEPPILNDIMLNEYTTNISETAYDGAG